MVERILEQQQAICSVLVEDRKNWHKMPSEQELEAVCSVLKPLATFTDALSGEKHITISAVLPLVNHITQELLKLSPTDGRIAKYNCY